MSSSDRRSAFVRVAIAAVVIAAISFIAYRAGWFDTDRVARWAGSLREHDRIRTAAIFVAMWGVMTSVGFPAIPLIVAGGALFGTRMGTTLNLVGTALGALGGYILARNVAPDLARRWVGRHLPHDELSGTSGFLTLVRLRLLPMVPFWAVTYGSALARVPIRPYLASTIVGQLPSTVLYSYLADKLVESAGRGGKVFGRELMLVSVLLLLLSFVPGLFHRKARH